MTKSVKSIEEIWEVYRGLIKRDDADRYFGELSKLLATVSTEEMYLSLLSEDDLDQVYKMLVMEVHNAKTSLREVDLMELVQENLTIKNIFRSIHGGLALSGLERFYDMFKNIDYMIVGLTNASVVPKHREYIAKMLKDRELQEIMLYSKAGPALFINLCIDVEYVKSIDEELLMLIVQIIDEIIKEDLGQRRELGRKKMLLYSRLLICTTQDLRMRELLTRNELKMLKMIFNILKELDMTVGMSIAKNCLWVIDIHDLFVQSDMMKTVIECILDTRMAFSSVEMNKLPFGLRPTQEINSMDGELSNLAFDCLQILCSSLSGRKALRQYNVYAILREYGKLSGGTMEQRVADILSFVLRTEKT